MWRSILHGRDVLKRGLIHRVGPGKISVWEDNWISGAHSLKPLARMSTTTAMRVCDLFIPGTRVWDEEAVCKSFLALDVVEMLKIKPSNQLENDVLAWAFERNRTCSVRSAYKLLKEAQMAATMAATVETMVSNDGRTWNGVWKLNVPPKVRAFWWHLLHNSLPIES